MRALSQGLLTCQKFPSEHCPAGIDAVREVAEELPIARAMKGSCTDERVLSIWTLVVGGGGA